MLEIIEVDKQKLNFKKLLIILFSFCIVLGIAVLRGTTTTESFIGVS